MEDGRAVVDGVPYDVRIAAADGDRVPATATATVEKTGTVHELVAPFPALLFRIEAQPGSTVAQGATVVILESMKMETPLAAPVSGTVESVRFAAGDQIKSGEVVATIRES